MSNQREVRKNEHVKLALAQNTSNISDFDRVHFVHHAIPNIDMNDVDLSANFPDFNLSKALFINAMTGGSEWTMEINQSLPMLQKQSASPWQ